MKQIWIIGSRDADHYVPPEALKDLKDLEPQEWPPVTPIDPNSGKGSADFAALCERLLRPYTQAQIDLCDKAVTFEHYGETMAVARNVLDRLLRGLPAHRVVVDVTGGTKITSIVGATLTLNRGTAFQYVDTQSPHQVIPFLLATEDPPGTHGH